MHSPRSTSTEFRQRKGWFGCGYAALCSSVSVTIPTDNVIHENAIVASAAHRRAANLKTLYSHVGDIYVHANRVFAAAQHDAAHGGGVVVAAIAVTDTNCAAKTVLAKNRYMNFIRPPT